MMHTESASTHCEAHAYTLLFISSLDAVTTFSGISRMSTPRSQVVALAPVVAVILLMWVALGLLHICNTWRL